MTNKFDEFLKDLNETALAAPEAVNEPTPAAVSVTEDKYAHLVGHSGPLVETSPWDTMLEAMTADAPAELLEEVPNYVEHKWKTIREAIYEDDYYVWRCEQCLKQINVTREESLQQSLTRHCVNPVCSTQAMEDVQSS